MVKSLSQVSVFYKVRQMTFSGLSMFDLDIQNIRVKFGVVIFKYKKNYICEYSIFYWTVLAVWFFFSLFIFLFSFFFSSSFKNYIPANIYLIKVNNRNT